MTTASSKFDHSAINIPGITLPDDPAAAAEVFQGRVLARQDPSATHAHADVMRDMRGRIAQHAARG